MHQFTINLIIILVPLIIFLSYKIGMKKQKEELERQRRLEMQLKYMQQQREKYQSSNNRLHPDDCYIQDRFNDHIYQSPINPNKRLSFSNFSKIPSHYTNNNNNSLLNEYDNNIVKQILGPSPRQSLDGNDNLIYHSINNNNIDLMNEKENYQNYYNLNENNLQYYYNNNDKKDYYYENTLPLREQQQYQSNSSQNRSHNGHGSADTYFSFRKSDQQYDHFYTPSLQKNHRYNQQQYNNNEDEYVYKIIQNRNCIPHINTPIKSFRNSSVQNNVPYFLQDRKITNLR